MRVIGTVLGLRVCFGLQSGIRVTSMVLGVAAIQIAGFATACRPTSQMGPAVAAHACVCRRCLARRIWVGMVVQGLRLSSLRYSKQPCCCFACLTSAFALLCGIDVVQHAQARIRVPRVQNNTRIRVGARFVGGAHGEGGTWDCSRKLSRQRRRGSFQMCHTTMRKTIQELPIPPDTCHEAAT